jgi:hypothetical protein
MSASSTPLPISLTSVVGSIQVLSHSSLVEMASSPQSNFDATEGVRSSSEEVGSVQFLTAAKAESSTVPKDAKRMSSDMSKIRFTVGAESEDDEESVLKLNQRGNRAVNPGSSSDDCSMKQSWNHSQTSRHQKAGYLQNTPQQDHHHKRLTRTSPPSRDVKECLAIYANSEGGAKGLTDEEVISLVKANHIQAYQLEKAVGDLERGISVR